MPASWARAAERWVVRRQIAQRKVPDMRFLLLGLLFASLSALAGCSNNDPVQPGKDESPSEKAEVAKLQGTWEVTTWKEQGVEDRNFVEFVSPKLVFNGDKHAWKAGPASHEGTFKVGSKGNLRSVDLVITTDGKGKNQLGIYELDGDELKICLARVDTAARPTTFASKADGAEYILATFKRQEKK
jgi:uncharacterized protein (TIGR03067 family)